MKEKREREKERERERDEGKCKKKRRDRINRMITENEEKYQNKEKRQIHSKKTHL
jgi:hypothetical protein